MKKKTGIRSLLGRMSALIAAAALLVLAAPIGLSGTEMFQVPRAGLEYSRPLVNGAGKCTSAIRTETSEKSYSVFSLILVSILLSFD